MDDAALNRPGLPEAPTPESKGYYEQEDEEVCTGSSRAGYPDGSGSPGRLSVPLALLFLSRRRSVRAVGVRRATAIISGKSSRSPAAMVGKVTSKTSGSCLGKRIVPRPDRPACNLGPTCRNGTRPAKSPIRIAAAPDRQSRDADAAVQLVANQVKDGFKGKSRFRTH